MARNRGRRADCIAALRLGLDLGMALIDTGDGKVEELVGTTIAGCRDRVFLVSKVYPPGTHFVDLRRSIKSWIPGSFRSLVPAPAKTLVRSVLQASQWGRTTRNLEAQPRTRQDIDAACERSLRRLRTDRLDLYLLHRRGTTPLAEAAAGFQDLIRGGKIRYFGVTNFGIADLEEWWSLAGGSAAATNQVLYNLDQRAIEKDLLSWCQRHSLPIMAYSPLDQGRIVKHPALGKIAARHGVSPAPVALAWPIRQEGVIAIPEALHRAHVRANITALHIHLTPLDLAELDAAFPQSKLAAV